MSQRRELKRGDTQGAILSEDQVEELKLAFDLFDANQTGYLDKSDCRAVVDKYGIKVTPKEVDEMFQEADVTGSGKIGFPEFMSMMARRMKQVDTQEELMEAFRVFDPYNEGIIPEKDLAEALLNTGDKLSKDELAEMLKVCLVDGQVNYKNFVNTMYATK
eukprot:TRINITY_DN355_c0_g1_i1.p1 TRINITY_DN355_c0_g1~~TRINITY_DN355_c0_g1_i1.p1  ORF type:complete len:161 (-),score=50.11 TRINITY_DN355_c0_g1_i1:53-535(-)